MNEINVWTVLIAATVTAIFTGFGALPFLFVRNVSDRWLGAANAGAAGLMLGASVGLILEGVEYGFGRLFAGLALGVGLIYITRKLLEGREDVSIGDLSGATAFRAIMIIGIMTVHSFAEGIGVGVSYGDGMTLGSLITAAIAVHNIPEGLAISLVLIPRGTSVWKAAGWSIFSSLPQPLMAVPAFLFVLAFRPFLPVGLGLAAGAMIWMVFAELLPEAREDAPASTIMPVMALAVVGMLMFQFLIG